MGKTARKSYSMGKTTGKQEYGWAPGERRDHRTEENKNKYVPDEHFDDCGERFAVVTIRLQHRRNVVGVRHHGFRRV